MTGRIYLLNDKSELLPMEEALYDSERLLQEMLAEHPDLLAGEQIDSEAPRRWLLVAREMAVPGELNGSGRWSLDHLFLDQDAVPTLVEVKRSTDTRIRREVIAQMLDYAANAVVYWPVEEIRAKFEARCLAESEDADEVLTTFLGEETGDDDYWQRVKTNLQAGKIRLVFIADAIPAELRRIVEFLNEQMDPAEVLAVEVKQFVGKGMKTLVPRVLGQTETARKRKSTGAAGMKWDEATFMAALAEAKGQPAARVAKELLDWITPQVSYVWWGQGADVGGLVPVVQRGGAKYQVWRMTTRGWFVVRFDWLGRKPPFDQAGVRQKLLDKINEIPGVQFSDEVVSKQARIPVEKLANPAAVEKAKQVTAWLLAQIPSTT